MIRLQLFAGSVVGSLEVLLALAAVVGLRLLA